MTYLTADSIPWVNSNSLKSWENIQSPFFNFITCFLATIATFTSQGLTTEAKACKWYFKIYVYNYKCYGQPASLMAASWQPHPCRILPLRPHPAHSVSWLVYVIESDGTSLMGLEKLQKITKLLSVFSLSLITRPSGKLYNE